MAAQGELSEKLIRASMYKQCFTEITMNIWTQLPMDLVRTVLAQPGVSCSVKAEIGKQMGWNLIGKVCIPDGLEAKLNRIMAARVPESQLMGLRTQLYEIESADAKIKLQLFIMSDVELGYKIIVKKKKVQNEYLMIQRSDNKWYEWSKREWLAIN